VILDQAVDYYSHYVGSSCCLLFPLFWIRLLATILIILDQAVGYCFHFFWTRLLVTVPVILNQAVGYSSHYFGSGC
jgi:hypothetical protein